MSSLLMFFAVITILICFYGYKKPEKHILFEYLQIFSVGLLIRIFVSIYVDNSFHTDVNCFSGWGTMVYNNGFSNFYFTDAFTDYPPAYMYILYILEALRVHLDIVPKTQEGLFLLRLPAILSDIATSILIFKFSLELFDKKYSRVLSFLYLLNPAIILVSSVWIQVDSLFTLVTLISLYKLKKEEFYLSASLFALAIMLKQQSLMFAPMYIFAFGYMIFKNKFGIKAIKISFFSALIFITTIFLICVPFAQNFDFTPIINQYTDSLTQYGYATFNAYNFYALLGENHSADTVTLLGITVSTWGLIANIATVIISLLALNKNKSKFNFYFIAGFINFTTFMFAARMHERYLFATMLMFLMAYLYSKDVKMLILYIGVTFTTFFNCYDILRVFNNTLNDTNYNLIAHSLYVISIINFALYIYMIYTFLKSISSNDYCFKEESIEKEDEIEKEEIQVFNELEEIDNKNTFDKKDFFAMSIITLVYTIIAFTNLGNISSPETYQFLKANEEIVIKLPENTKVSKIQYFLGPRHNKDIEILYSYDNINYEKYSEFRMVSVFAWGEEQCDFAANYIKLKALSDEIYIFEFAIRDENNNIIDIDKNDILTNNAKNMFDEVEQVPEYKHYMNSSIFDEIYHPRTAYEFIHELKVYETTHPPLGKILISFGIKMFGMNPFGWRFMGTLCGVAMVPLMYIFSKRMFKSSIFACFSAIVFTFDFMHFTQTRLGTIDSYTVFFIMLMYYFMYEYYEMNFYKTSLKKTLIPLFLSGVSMGLAIATKWQGVYAGVGLAVIFFYTIYLRYIEYKEDREDREVNNTSYTDVFVKNLVITLSSCILFFVIIPIIIYGLSYIAPINTVSYTGEGYINFIVNNQISMYEYHSELEATHTFASSWWAWIFNIRPIFYSFTNLGDGMVSSISSFGNPAVWYMGIAGFIYSLISVFKKKDRSMLFLIIALSAQMLPWILVPRITFIYHYFPSIPFLVLMITYLFSDCFEKVNSKYKYIYLVLVVLLFIIFYPVISGLQVSSEYVNKFLEWFPTWHFA